jgi:hypothetical protein
MSRERDAAENLSLLFRDLPPQEQQRFLELIGFPLASITLEKAALLLCKSKSQMSRIVKKQELLAWTEGGKKGSILAPFCRSIWLIYTGCLTDVKSSCWQLRREKQGPESTCAEFLGCRFIDRIKPSRRHCFSNAPTGANRKDSFSRIGSNGTPGRT